MVPIRLSQLAARPTATVMKSCKEVFLEEVRVLILLVHLFSVQSLWSTVLFNFMHFSSSRIHQRTKPNSARKDFCFNSKQRTFNLNCLLRIKIKLCSDALNAIFFWPPSWKVLDWNDCFCLYLWQGTQLLWVFQRCWSAKASFCRGILLRSWAKSASGSEIQAEKSTGRHIYPLDKQDEPDLIYFAKTII